MFGHCNSNPKYLCWRNYYEYFFMLCTNNNNNWCLFVQWWPLSPPNAHKNYFWRVIEARLFDYMNVLPHAVNASLRSRSNCRNAAVISSALMFILYLISEKLNWPEICTNDFCTCTHTHTIFFLTNVHICYSVDIGFRTMIASVVLIWQSLVFQYKKAL